MFLAIDAGNTNIVFAVFKGAELFKSWRMETRSSRTADEYASVLFQLFTQSGLSFDDIQEALISSVVPDANFQLKRLCEETLGCPVRFVGQDHLDLGMNIAIDKPEELGADRLVNAVAVARFYRYPAIVIDFGTATTFDVVDAQGRYAGGVIAPGVNLSMTALHLAAAKLPKVDIKKPGRVIGKNTVEAMQAGIYWGYVGLVEGTLQRMKQEMEHEGEDCFILATGGLAQLFAGNIEQIEKVDESLTLRGLIHIHERNQHKKAA